jgi:hypothetical protein
MISSTRRIRELQRGHHPAIFARWARFTSDRDFYRYANAHLIDAFPTLPDRSQFNWLLRHSLGLIEEIALHLADEMEGQRCPYQALDSSAMHVRDVKLAEGGQCLAPKQRSRRC